MINVLIIEDNQPLATLLQRYFTLRFQGSETTHVTKITEGWDQLTSGEHFDLVLCDGHLPDGEGPNLVETVVRSFVGPPFIGMSADPHMLERLGLCGCQGLLQKPFSLDHLTAAILVVSFPEETCDDAINSVSDVAVPAGDRPSRLRADLVDRADRSTHRQGHPLSGEQVAPTAPSGPDAA